MNQQTPKNNSSPAELLAQLSKADRDKLLDSLSDTALDALKYNWDFMGRPKQLTPPGDWRIWLIMAGRGFGKTRTGAEWIRGLVESGRAKRVALVGRTSADVRDVMAEGPSGLIPIATPSMRPKYEPSKRRLIWPNGAVATMFTADEPNLLRGPQFDAAWCDELAAWKYTEAFDQLMFGLRLGSDPRCVITTTPRPIQIIRDLMESKSCFITKGSTYENAVNLAPQFFHDIINKYEGTTLGRQELYAEVIDEMPGALWSRSLIEKCRVSKEEPDIIRVVVAVDPAMGGKNETGIVVCGTDSEGKGYVLDDCSIRATPDQWAQKAINTYHLYKADRIVAEVNQGGDLVERVLRTKDDNISYKRVSAMKGKVARAEPVAALYEQGKVFHMKHFGKLEDQMCSYVPGDRKSPDRLDALVWGLTDIMLNRRSVTDYKVSDFGLRAAPWKL